MTVCSQILTLLEELVKGYRSLHALLQREKICLIGLDAPAIGEIANSKIFRARSQRPQ